MKLNQLQPNEGSFKKKMVVGRGIGCGKGKTCGRGVKGQKARTGVAIAGFEGGQMPLYRRLPKMGFSNTPFASKPAELSLGRLQEAIDSKQVDAKKPLDEETLFKAGVAKRQPGGIKLLSGGELKTKVDLKITKASKSAQEAVKKTGGSIEFVVRTVAPVKRPDRSKAGA